jgi:hypothetical protein
VCVRRRGAWLRSVCRVRHMGVGVGRDAAGLPRPFSRRAAPARRWRLVWVACARVCARRASQRRSPCLHAFRVVCQDARRRAVRPPDPPRRLL